MNAATVAITEAECVLRATGSRKGRTRWLSPGAAPVRHLHYGRIILEGGDAPVEFANEKHETGLIALGGGATVRVSTGETFELSLYDAVYIPRNREIEVTPAADGCDLAEVSSQVDHEYPLQFVSFAEVQKDKGLHFPAGAESFTRTVNILLGKNVQAGRIVAGVTFSKPGNWTSWPPHEHAEMLEEAYLYIAMPAPAWGMQFVYTDPQSPELAVAVRQDDCVVMPKGYHPNVAAPGGSINFLWMMAAHREVADRQFGAVNVQPEYAGGGSGLEAGR
jgi:5-deoxy-glucuronate isomerase